MRVLTVANNKGGEGKTSTSRMLAEWSARSGYRTLVMDMDAQANLSRRFLTMEITNTGVMPPVHSDFDPNDPDDAAWGGRSSVVDIYGVRSAGVFPYKTALDNLEILPAYGHEMRRLEMKRADEVKEQIYERVREFARTPDVQEAYDVIIIDTPPALSPLMISAVRAATHLLIPCQMETQSMEGLNGILQMWRQENTQRRPDERVDLIGILPNRFRAGVNLHEGIRETLSATPAIQGFMMPVQLCQRTAFAETDLPDAKPKSIFDGADNPARREAIEVCTYVFDRLMAGVAPPVAEPAVSVGERS